MQKFLTHRPIFYSALICLCPSVWAYDTDSVSEEIGVIINAASDWIYDGTTETQGEPSIGINAEWRLLQSLFLGFDAREADVRRNRQRQRSVGAYIGLDQTFGNDWYTSFSIQHREFPGSLAEWDFTEFIFQLAYQDNWLLSLDYSPDYYERDTEGYGGTLSYSHNFNRNTYWSAQVGSQQLSEQRFTDYHYANIGIGYSASRLNVDLSYGWNSENGTILFGQQPLLSPQLLLQVSYRLK